MVLPLSGGNIFRIFKPREPKFHISNTRARNPSRRHDFPLGISLVYVFTTIGCKISFKKIVFIRKDRILLVNP
jgi:hypothetical protein